MITETRETSFPETYERLVHLLPAKPWLSRTQKLQYQIKDNPLTRESIERTYRIAYGLSSFDRAGMDLVEGPEWQNVKYAMTFAAQALYLIDAAQDEKGRSAYVGRIGGAFKDPDTMRALISEHLTALHLHMRGLQIEWPPEHKGEGKSFDILAAGEGMPAFEVECKSFSSDKGKQITQDKAMEFFKQLTAKLGELRQPDTLRMIRITVPKKLPPAVKDQERLALQVVEAVRAGQTEVADGVQVSAIAAPISELRGLRADEALLAQRILANKGWGAPMGIRHFSTEVIDNYLLCVEVCSTRKNDRMSAWWEDATYGVREQMTGTRPGCLVIRMENMPSELLKAAAGNDQSLFRDLANRMFDDERHKHLACIVYVGDGDRIVHSTPRSEAVASTSFVLVNEKGLYAESGIDRLFVDA